MIKLLKEYFRYNKKLDPILALRGFACLCIIWFHLRPGSWLIIKGVDLSFLTAPSGTLAVYIFYLISGYTVGYGFFSKRYKLSLRSLSTFYANRFLRIAPAYYICILLSIFVFYPGVRTTFYDFVRFITFTANLDYFTLPFQFLLAIISTEMQFYLIAPILFIALSLFIRKIHPLIIGALIICMGVIVRFILLSAGLIPDLSMYMLHVYVTVPGMIDYFLFGMFLGYISFEKTKEILRLKNRVPSVFFYGLLIGWFLWISYGNFFGLTWEKYALYHLFVIPPTLIILIGWYILSETACTRFIRHHITTLGIIKLLIHPKTFLLGVGTLSYGLFLYHFIFFDILYRLPDHVLDNMPAFISRFIIIFTLTTIMALASFQFIEYPISRLRNKKP